MAERQRLESQKKFWLSVVKTHQHKYAYDKTTFNKITDKIVVTCPMHGDFKLTADHHMRGVGCAKCANQNRTGGYSDSWFAYDPTRKIEPAVLYLVQMKNEFEEFLKVGITKKSIKHRYRGCKYKYEVIYEQSCNLYDAFKVEQIAKQLRANRYYPKGGDYKTESFTIEAKDELLSLLENELAVRQDMS